MDKLIKSCVEKLLAKYPEFKPEFAEHLVKSQLAQKILAAKSTKEDAISKEIFKSFKLANKPYELPQDADKYTQEYFAQRKEVLGKSIYSKNDQEVAEKNSPFEKLDKATLVSAIYLENKFRDKADTCFA